MKKYLATMTAVLLTSLSGLPGGMAQDPTAAVVKEEDRRITENQKAQLQVDRVHQETTELVSTYHSKLKIVDGLKVYNALLLRQIERQDEEVATLKASIANATVIERQMVPLLMRMLDGLEEFIALDVPFLLEEREHRVEKLRFLMERADLTVAEKSRRVFEAYQIENDYGRTLEAYKGKLDLKDRTFDVDYLRIGRVALLYRSVGNDQFGHWDVRHRQWVMNTESQYRRNITTGLKIARQEMAPELFATPIPPAEEM
jgi:hypothetical protein